MLRIKSMPSLALMGLFVASFPLQSVGQNRNYSSWENDLGPISEIDWNYERAAHLLERAGFGGTPDTIQRFANMSPSAAVKSLVHFDKSSPNVNSFDHSGIHDAGLDPFPPSRPATTELAKKNGEALGVKVKPTGNRRLQPVVNKFFYWLRASVLETNRVSYWWANRMVASEHPLQEKMALFWHGHYAVNESKVRDYRKLLKELYISVAPDFKW